MNCAWAGSSRPVNGRRPQRRSRRKLRAAEEAAKVKELEEKALRAREEKQRDELLAQNKALSERLLAMCPTSKPVQPVYAPQTVSSPHTSLSLPAPLPAPPAGSCGQYSADAPGFHVLVCTASGTPTNSCARFKHCATWSDTKHGDASGDGN